MSEVKKIATRESYGHALVELGKEHEEVVVLDADLAEATKTGIFKKEFPERHIDCGIAECNMMGIAAGVDITEAYQVGGAAVKAAYEHQGPVYLRFGRLAVPVINDRPDYKFEIGKGVVLKEGTDLTIVATGLCVNESLMAAAKLEEEGIHAQVINIHTIKPIDADLIAEAAKKTGKIVTVEEHSVIGGLGSAVCDVLCEREPVKVLKIGMNDVFGESGPAVKLLEKYGLDAAGIYAKIKAWL